MFSKKKEYIHIQQFGITIVLWAIVMFLLFPSCSSKKKDLGEAIMERDSLPSMTTMGVMSLISDSGIIRYQLNAEEWLIYDKKNPPYWAFEKGIYVEKFDSLMNADAFIEADTAYYYERQKLWKLLGNVVIKNVQGDQIETSLLYWDQNTQKVYSDRYTKIIQEGNTIIGRYGFESTQQLTKYDIYNSEGIFNVSETPRDSLKTDTIKITPDTISQP